MKFSKQKLFASSIDWYMLINGRWVQGVSLGGFIPDSVDDSTNLPLLQSLCSSMPDILTPDEVETNDNLIRQRFLRHTEIINTINQNLEEPLFSDNEFVFDNFKNRYTEFFVDAARKGFYSYARYDVDDPQSTDYRLIACPTSDASRQLNENLQRRLSEVLIPELNSFLENIVINNDNIPTPSFDLSLRW